jgi:beta-lactamase superfamily II metal-dependent hydrolase
VAVVTVGDGNLYRHPAEEVVARYAESRAALYRTDRHGAVMVRLGQTGTTVSTWSELILRRISTAERDGWWTIERENWKRMALRTAGI